jgi:hypothetical protein
VLSVGRKKMTDRKEVAGEEEDHAYLIGDGDGADGRGISGEGEA